MADVQLENGYTKISNDLLDALCRHLPGNAAGRVLLAILRKTYGWNKKEDAISITQFQDMTGLSKRSVIYALQELEAKKMITIKRHNNDVNKIAFCKDYDGWLVQNSAPQVCMNRENAKKFCSAKPCTGAKVRQKVVQNSVKGSANPLHPQKKIQKTITKENMVKLSDKDTLSAYLLTLPEYQNLSAQLKDLILTYINKIRQSNKTKVLSQAKATRTLCSLSEIKTDYGEDILKAGIEAVFNKEQKDGFVYSSNNPTGYIKAVAKSLHTRSKQTEIEQRSRAEKAMLDNAPGGTIYKEVTDLLKN